MKVVIDVDDMKELLDYMVLDRVVGVLEETAVMWDPEQSMNVPVYKVVWP